MSIIAVVFCHVYRDVANSRQLSKCSKPNLPKSPLWFNKIYSCVLLHGMRLLVSWTLVRVNTLTRRRESSYGPWSDIPRHKEHHIMCIEKPFFNWEKRIRNGTLLLCLENSKLCFSIKSFESVHSKSHLMILNFVQLSRKGEKKIAGLWWSAKNTLVRI